MVTESLSELLAVSNEWATLRNATAKPAQPVPDDTVLHQDIAEILATNAYGLTWLGIDADRIDEFSERARSRGVRNRVYIFGWHPQGTTWYATPMDRRGDATVLVMSRVPRLSITELSVDEFVTHCVEEIRKEIEAATAEPEPEPEAQPEEEAKAAPEGKRRRPPIKVVLEENNGAVVVADGKSEAFSPEEWGYIRWCVSGLQLLSEGDAPDLSRWEARCLRACRLDTPPAEGDPARAEWDKQWARLTRKDRAAVGPISHQIPNWKFAAPGHWAFAKTELPILRRAEKAIPPRHKPSKDQRKLWARWVRVIQADQVELFVR